MLICWIYFACCIYSKIRLLNNSNYVGNIRQECLKRFPLFRAGWNPIVGDEEDRWIHACGSLLVFVVYVFRLFIVLASAAEMAMLNNDYLDPSLMRPSVLWLGMDLKTSLFKQG